MRIGNALIISSMVSRTAQIFGYGPKYRAPGMLRLRVTMHPRRLVAERDRHERVGLVVAELDVERRVELLDPGVLELQRLEVAADDRPLDADAVVSTMRRVRSCRLRSGWK